MIRFLFFSAHPVGCEFFIDAKHLLHSPPKLDAFWCQTKPSHLMLGMTKPNKHSEPDMKGARKGLIAVYSLLVNHHQHIE